MQYDWKSERRHASVLRSLLVLLRLLYRLLLVLRSLLRLTLRLLVLRLWNLLWCLSLLVLLLRSLLILPLDLLLWLRRGILRVFFTLNKLLILYNYFRRVDCLAFPVRVGTGLDPASDTDFYSLMEIFFRKFRGFAECGATDEISAWIV